MKKMARGVLFFYAVSVLIMIISCTKELTIEDMGFEKSFNLAMKKYNEADYISAVSDFNVILLNYGGEQGIDQAQFLLAKSHFELEEFYSASYEFVRLTERFPESEFVEEAYFMDAECFKNLSPRYALDQEETHKAISKYQTYLDLYPKGKFSGESATSISELREKLARKEFEAGVLYLKLDQPRAAKIYFGEIINNYYDTSYYSESLKNIAQAYLEMKDEYRYLEFMSKYNELNSPEKK
ncbi:MAG: outer membrane protein assembly factor BamD [Candidatus Delongbacteria bacterium]|nr:outer membrane protein assembly factor BamD [Candidatus Delongbacteria bacterium]